VTVIHGQNEPDQTLGLVEFRFFDWGAIQPGFFFLPQIQVGGAARIAKSFNEGINRFNKP